MTWLEFARRLLPGEPDEVLDIILWNHTALPCSTDPKRISKELLLWKRLRNKGLSSCCICGKGFKSRSGKVILGAECGSDHGMGRIL